MTRWRTGGRRSRCGGPSASSPPSTAPRLAPCSVLPSASDRAAACTALSHAVAHALRKSRRGWPVKRPDKSGKSAGMIRLVGRSSPFTRSTCSVSRSFRSAVSTTTRPSPFFVWPGSRASVPASRSSWRCSDGQHFRLHSPAVAGPGRTARNLASRWTPSAGPGSSGQCARGEQKRRSPSCEAGALPTELFVKRLCPDVPCNAPVSLRVTNQPFDPRELPERQPRRPDLDPVLPLA